MKLGSIFNVLLIWGCRDYVGTHPLKYQKWQFFMPPLLKEIEFWKKKTWNRIFFCKPNTKILHSILIEHSNARNNSNSWRKLPFRVFFPRKSLAAWCLKARKNSLYFGHLEKDYLCSHDLKIINPLLKIVRKSASFMNSKDGKFLPTNCL